MSSDVLPAGIVTFFDANGFLAELLVAAVLVAWRLPRRTRFAARSAAVVVALVAVSWVWGALVPAAIWSSVLRFVLLVALTGLGVAACWRLRPPQVLFTLVVAAVLQHFAFRGSSIVTALVHQAVPDAAWVDVVVYPLGLVPFFAAGYVLFVRPVTEERAGALLRHGSLLMLLVGMLISVNVFTLVFDELRPGEPAGADAVYLLLDLITCVFLLALTREVVGRRSAEQDSEITRHLLHQQRTQLESSRETIELINIKTHDLKHQIALLGDRIPQDEVDELRRLVGIYDATARTGNEALDVLLAEKLLICETRGIPFDRIVDGRLLAAMRPGDVYSLFGNALDNAIEAVADVAEPDRRYIALRVRRRKGLLAIRVENAYEGERVFEDGLPRTTKQDTRFHGFGMRSIRMICERYDGVMSVSARDGVFALTLLLPLPGAEQPA